MEAFVENPEPIAPAIPDLNVSNPAQDFWWLLKSPGPFFDFFRGDREFSRWLIFKSIAGLLLFSWLAEFARGTAWLDELVRGITPYLTPKTLNLISPDVDATALRAKILMSFITISHLKMFIAPVWDLIDLAGVAASTTLFLPFVGVDRKSFSFHSLFFAGAFVRWFYVVGVIPVVGPWLMSLVVIAFSIFAVKRIAGVGAWKAFVATFLLYWLSLCLLPALAAIALAIFFLIPHT